MCNRSICSTVHIWESMQSGADRWKLHMCVAVHDTLYIGHQVCSCHEPLKGSPSREVGVLLDQCFMSMDVTTTSQLSSLDEMLPWVLIMVGGSLDARNKCACYSVTLKSYTRTEQFERTSLSNSNAIRNPRRMLGPFRCLDLILDTYVITLAINQDPRGQHHVKVI